MADPIRESPSGPLKATGADAQTWAETLSLGHVTAGVSPEIVAPDMLVFSGLAAFGHIECENSLEINCGDKLGEEGGGLFVQSGSSDNSAGGQIVFECGISTGNIGGRIELNAGPGLEGGDIDIYAGDVIFGADGAGGRVEILGGAGAGGELGVGGNIIATPGSGNGVNILAGAILLNHASAATAIQIVHENAAGHTGGQAILISSAGLAFFDGTPVSQPTANDLATLGTALGNMGLINWTG